MATSVAQYPVEHARRASTNCASSSSSTRPAKQMDVYDRFYGHRAVSELSEAVITSLFACPLDSSSSSDGPTCAASRPTPRLAEFIAYALHRTRLPEEITYQALFLLRRLKSRFPAARGSSGHRLFISALMLASKSSCDDTYSNKSWTIVSQGLFTLREVNQMERELFGYLGFKVNVEMPELALFRHLLHTGDMAAVLDCQGSVQCSPNPQSISPVVDRAGCDTPTASTPTKATAEASRASSIRHAHDVNVSSYSGDAHPTSPCSGGKAASSLDPRSISHPYQSVGSYPTTAGTSYSNLSPSSASITSSRGSISSASGSSMVPSPTSASHSEASSSRTSPDTPPSELCGSPWAEVEGKAVYYGGGEPAGTYDDHMQFYQHLKNQQQQHYYGQQSAHVYASAVANHRNRHPY